MRNTIEGILETYGTDVTVESAGAEKRVRCFFQAVNAKSWRSMESEATLLGEISRGQYLYLGPAEEAVREGDTLHLGQRAYRFRRVEDYYYGNQVLYRWGLCVERGVNDTWGSQS